MNECDLASRWQAKACELRDAAKDVPDNMTATFMLAKAAVYLDCVMDLMMNDLNAPAAVGAESKEP